MAEEGWVEPEHLRQLLTKCVLANQAAALQTLDLHPGLLSSTSDGGERISLSVMVGMYFGETRPYLLPAGAGARGLWSSC